MENNNHEKITIINNNDILPNRFQPRKTFSEDELLDLTESIKKYGILEPIIVRPLGDKYELIAGERRYKANVLAGNDTIPTIVKNLNDSECSEIAIIENLQRKDLSPLEEALSYKRVIDLGYSTQQQLAEKLGKSQSYIANKIRLLKLSDKVQDALMANKISERHARSILRIDSIQKQNEILDRIIAERLTVRRTDEEIDKMNNENNNMNNGESLQTTPLSSIFSENNINNQSINENEIFKFGPESSNDDISNQPLMSFDANGNLVNNNMNNGSSVQEVSNMATTENNSVPFGSFNDISNDKIATPNMSGIPMQENNNPSPFGMFNNGSNEEVATPNMPGIPMQENNNPTPFGMFNSVSGDTVAAPNMPGMQTQENDNPAPFGMFNSVSNEEVATPNIPGMQTQENNNPAPFGMFNSVSGDTVAAPNMPGMQTQENNNPAPFGMFNSVSNEEVATPNIPGMPMQENNNPAPFEMFNSVSNEEVATPNMPGIQTQENDNPTPFGMFNNNLKEVDSTLINQNTEVQPIPFMNNDNKFNGNIGNTGINSDSISNNDTEHESIMKDNNNKGAIESSIPSTPIYDKEQMKDTIGEFKKPDPIIVTDYNKQYDPVMPDSKPKTPDIDLKTIINLIRQCSDTIEKCGYKIDTEEYDLENMYQVVFKIEKM